MFARLIAIIATLALPAWAVRPSGQERADAKRFGLDSLASPVRRGPDQPVRQEFARFNAAAGGRWSIRFDPRTGAPAALTEGKTPPRAGPAAAVSRRFLEEQRALLRVDPAALHVEKEIQGEGRRHVLYRQTYRGLPVEFSRVKVHLDDDGSVIGFNSNYEAAATLPTVPAISAQTAKGVAETDARGQSQGPAELVILPAQIAGRARLAWKLKVRGAQAAWRYYIDALDGRILFRYNALRFATNGTVTGQVYDLDPTGPLVTRPFANQWIYIGDASVRALSGGDGTYASASNGKVTMGLQGKFVNVANFRGPSAHYDNGSGVWQTIATPVSSPHPYPNSSVQVSTITLESSVPTAVKFLPIFSAFDVGVFTGGDASDVSGGDIADDDQVTITDGNGDPVASYVGARGAFNAGAVAGKVMHVSLRSNESGQNPGFDIALSSYLTVTSPSVAGTPGSENHVWTLSDTALALRGELNLFYHLNLMHDYFFGGVNRSSAAAVSGPLLAMAHVGPNMVNAFYNPDQDNLMFGDVSAAVPRDVFTDDATVTRHEYVHYLLEKIWSIQNFGQAGAISEGIADYFAASSLNNSAIGAYVMASLGGGGPLRELDCQKAGQTCRVLSNTTWSGEIHDDSIFFSQALWDIRRARIAALGASAGRSCADGLVFQSLLFFPESFSEFYEALRRVDGDGRVSACGGAGTAQSDIITAFTTTHGLILANADGWERNDGFETATDASTMSAVSATISPSGDTDFWSFAAGPGVIRVTLNLPSAGGYFKAYQLKLFDRMHRLVASAAPAYNGINTTDGLCETNDCTTTAAHIELFYNNSVGGQFYVQVAGGDTVGGSASGVQSLVPYALSFGFSPNGALSGSIITASYDQDVISFSVNVTSFMQIQDWRFSSAQLRDHAFGVLPNTQASSPSTAGSYLTLISSASQLGRITGSVRLVPGFASRFPAAGTVHLEVFGYNVHGSTSSLGLSNPLNLSGSSAELKAYNNVFNPLAGEKATIKYSIASSGHVVIKLYTVTGGYIATLLDDEKPAGKGTLNWDGRNSVGAVVASGIYLVRIDGPGIHKTQKVAIVK
ncbi:MAG: M4 family metallopeptidase [Elusimicrobiota bacterium]